MADSTWWWVLAGALVAIELATGTFYLLMMALGAAAGALAAHLALSNALQMACAAIVGGAATWFWHMRRTAAAQASTGDPLAHMDVGQTVHVEQWGDDGTTRVQHRGVPWSARLRTPPSPGDAPAPGAYRIADMQGSELILEKV
jgi:membrane protein implicated in regulation of membrane protease activity